MESRMNLQKTAVSQNQGKNNENKNETKSGPSKRKRSSPPAMPKAKQTKIKDYWLSTQNRFSDLEDESESEIPPVQTIKIKPIKPPPIYISGVQNITPLTGLIEEVCKTNHFMKILNTDEVKIQTTEADDYRNLVKSLTDRNTQFHTYQPKQARSFRVVLRGLHPSSNVEDIKNEIEELNHEVINVYNIKQRRHENIVPLPLFYIDMKQKENNHEIYKLKTLLYTRVVIEPPNKKKTIPQCTRCQRYEHTWQYCNRMPRCVKCAGDHLTKQCPTKRMGDNVKCILCTGNHPASYKGCEYYTNLRNKKFPSLRERRETITENNEVNPAVSFADTVRQNIVNPPPQQNCQTQSTDITELKNTMKDLMGQFTNLISLITVLVTKISSNG